MTDQLNAVELHQQRAWNWVWPDDRNRWNTGLPVPAKQHANAHKCNFTPLPGCANRRHKKRLHALSGSGIRG